MEIDAEIREYNFKEIARYYGPLKQKFATPRQAGLAENLQGQIVFAPKYRDRSAFKGITGFSHLWLIWTFSENAHQEKFQPTVRPPRLHGDKRVGVWAPRSPNRPNPIAISAVRLENFIWDAKLGPVLYVSGADLVSGTAILDIKPYIVYADSIPAAKSAYAAERPQAKLKVLWPAETEKGEGSDASNALGKLTTEEKLVLEQVLSLDPRPAYQDDPERIYGFLYAAYNIKFRVRGNILTILSVENVESANQEQQ